MPAITTVPTAGTPLPRVLQEVLTTPQDKWNYFFIRPNLIKRIFEELTNTIQSRNFFNEDYSIKSFFDFLKSFVQYSSINKETLNRSVLNNLNTIFFSCKTTILKQKQLNQQQIDIITQYANYINIFFQASSRYWLVDDQIKFKMDDLSEMAIHVAKNNNASLVDFIYSYVSTLKLSFDVKKFMLDYQKKDEACSSIVSIGKALFSQTDKKINRVIPHLFSSLAYEYKLIAYYKASFKLSSSEIWQEKIIKAAMELQGNFFGQLYQRNDISKEGLKYYFFKYFIQKAEIVSPNKEQFASYFPYYANEHFTPLPLTSECPTSGANQFIIEHAGLAQDKLDIVCQAKNCAERNHAKLLQRLRVNPTQLPASHYIYRVFNETRFEEDLNFFTPYEPSSTGFYMSAQRNQTVAKGVAYVQYRSDLTSWWEVSGHEYAHHLHFKSFANIPRNFDEGLAYLVILSTCGDSSYRSWLEINHNNYTSLADLQSRDFIGYNPSFLYMSYLVDTNPPIFSEILQSYRTNNKFTAEKIIQLMNHDSHFVSWIFANREQCKNFTLEKLGESDGYCPPLLANDLEKNTYQNIFRTTRSIPLSTSTLSSNAGPALLTASKLTPDEMGYQLIFTISTRKLDEFRALLQNGANLNYLHKDTGNTPLHFLPFYGNCDDKYYELLLNYGAKVTPNLQGQLPLQIAEKQCNAMELLKIQETFARHAQQQELWLPISIPISALTSGVIAGVWQEIAQRNKDQYPYLPNIIFYGLKPATLAMSTAFQNALLAGPADVVDLEDFWGSFVYYLAVNYLGLVFAQIGEGLAQKIQNKFLSLFISILFYTFLINPSLLIELMHKGLTSETFSNVMPPALVMLLNGLLFKTSEYCTQRIINLCIPRNEQNANSRTYISYELSEIKDNEEDLRLNKHLIDFKNYFVHLKKLFEPILKNSAHLFIFKKNLNLLQEIADLENIKDIDANSNEFSKAVTALNDIKVALVQLDKIPNKETILEFITNEMIPAINAIKPSEAVAIQYDSVSNANSTPIELTTFREEKPRYTGTPQLRRNSSLFEMPPPPPPEELRMTEENPQTYQNIGQFHR